MSRPSSAQGLLLTLCSMLSLLEDFRGLGLSLRAAAAKQTPPLIPSLGPALSYLLLIPESKGLSQKRGLFSTQKNWFPVQGTVFIFRNNLWSWSDRQW